MCTILSFDMDMWKSNRSSLLHRIDMDNRWNSDGLSLICLNHSEPERSVSMRSMSLEFVRRTLIQFCEDTRDGRVFLHQRMATGFNVSLDYCHGWTDGRGRHLMHNGVIATADKKLKVDSQALIPHMAQGGKGLYRRLKDLGEYYANCFVVDSNDHSYGVVRMGGGSLFTDNLGNYSTVAVGPINLKVRRDSYFQFPGQLGTYRKQPKKHWGSSIKELNDGPRQPYKHKSDGEYADERNKLYTILRTYNILPTNPYSYTNLELEAIIEKFLTSKLSPPEDTVDELDEDTAEDYGYSSELVQGEVDEDRLYRESILEQLRREGKEHLITEEMSTDDLEDILWIPLHRVE